MNIHRWLSSRNTAVAFMAVVGLASAVIATYLLFRRTTESPTPTSAVGQDFEMGCIDSKYWTVYKGEKRSRDINGCWDLSSMGLSAQGNGLLITASNGETGIYTDLPESTEIRLTIRIDKLSRGSSLVFGPGNSKGPLSEKDFLVYRVVSRNSPVLVSWSSGDTHIPNYVYGQEQKLIFSINGLFLDIYINDSLVLESIPLSPSGKKVFWIGSRISNNGSVSALVKGFRVIKK